MDNSDDTRQLRLDHRHLAFFVLGSVAVCAIFFALGFVVGRGQTYEAAMKEQSTKTPELKVPALPSPASWEEPGESAKVAATGPGKPDAKRDQETDYRRELDFYNTLDQKHADENFRPDSQRVQRKLGSQENAKSKIPAVPRRPSKAPPGKLVSLQVGAYINAGDADKLAKTLRSKGYSVSLLNPVGSSGDRFIRIHVGPFAQVEEANKVKGQLEKDGYQVLIKR